MVIINYLLEVGSMVVLIVDLLVEDSYMTIQYKETAFNYNNAFRRYIV